MVEIMFVSTAEETAETKTIRVTITKTDQNQN